MSQYITNLPVGSLVNLIENRSGTKYLTPFLIIATGSGNPYGSDKVLCLRYRASNQTRFDASNSVLYDGSTIDTWLTDTYMTRFDAATKNCIATSTVKNRNILLNQDYTLARKAFILSYNEIGGHVSSDPSTTISNIPMSTLITAYDDTGANLRSWWFRTPATTSALYYIRNRGTFVDISTEEGNPRQFQHSARPALNLYASCKVSSEPNQDGSYNLMPSVYAGIGDGNTGVTAAAVDPSAFLQMISDIGSYTFTYTNGAWTYSGDTVDIADYGITVTGTPADGDTVIVTDPQGMQILDAAVSLGETDFMPTQCIVDWAEFNNGTTQLQLCNNYNDASPTWETSAKNTLHNFTNTTKTAQDWHLGARLYAMSENVIKIYAPHAIVRKW